MTLVPLEDFAADLICPRCRSPLVRDGERLACTFVACAYVDGFPTASGQPLLVDTESSVLDDAGLRALQGSSPIHRHGYSSLGRAVRRLMLGNHKTSRQRVADLVQVLGQETSHPRVLIVGGGALGHGCDALYADPTVDVIAFDIYASAVTQFVADGHRIPMADGTVHGVIVQGVVQHCIAPDEVVAEIHRVLKPRGLVYSEVGFVQQVCEGPYDFVRYTESGHRFLFKGFETVDSGIIAGPGTQLLWTVDHLGRAFFRSRTAGLVLKAAFFWLRFMDRLVSPAFARDAASCTYFLGRRSEQPMHPREILHFYRGAQKTLVAKQPVSSVIYDVSGRTRADATRAYTPSRP